jgi:hypothetical protein
VKPSRRARRLQADVLKTNRIGCGCALLMLFALILTMIVAAYFSAPHS